MNYYQFSLFCKDPKNYVPDAYAHSPFPKLRKIIASNGTGIIELDMDGDDKNILIIYIHHYNIMYSEKNILRSYPFIEYQLSRFETIEILKRYFPPEYDEMDIKEPVED